MFHCCCIRQNLEVDVPETAIRRCSEKYALLNFRNIHRKIPMLESLFNKIAGLQATLLKRDSNIDVFL